MASSFSSEINLNNTKDVLSNDPKVAASGNNVYVIWEEGTSTVKDIYFNTSSNSGSTFIAGVSKNLSPTATDAEKTKITKVNDLKTRKNENRFMNR